MNKIALTYIRKRLSRKRSLRESQFDSSAIADLAFLLLIFFIVTSSFILRQGIFLSLPDVDASSVKIDKDKIIQVTPMADGFMLNQKLVKRKKLLQMLTNKVKKNKDVVMVVHMKNNILYDRLIDTLSAAKEVNLRKFTIQDDE